MLFNSFEFLVFLPIVFALYWLLRKRVRWQNALIVVASYVFYGWWDWRFLILIAFTTLCSFVSGLGIERAEGDRRRQKWISAGNIIINLLVLGCFKYLNFFGENFSHLLQLLGLTADWTTLNIILPVGVSFYTFQALSYTIDVYRGKMQPTHDPVAFFAFIGFFPQLVAGPIERAANLLPQFQKQRRFTYEEGADGMRQILWGMFKKVVIADNCALVVNKVFADYYTMQSSTLILGALLFTIQIYCDFSGYSDIAIGTGKLFNIRLMRNFNNPYFSRDIAEFWRRWHISLTTWFRDYIYIPLGGSRTTKGKILRNTFVIFLVSGLWHGANWTFVCWGTYHALLFLPLILSGMNRKYTNIVAEGHLLPTLKECFQMGLTFILAAIGWIIFRSETIGQAWEYMVGLCTHWGEGYMDATCSPLLLVGIPLMLLVEWLTRSRNHGLDIANLPIWLRYTSYIAILSMILLFCGTEQTFIYFQF